MLEDEADENVVEGLGAEGQIENVRCRNSTFVTTARSALRRACVIESGEMSTDVNRAPGLRWASVTVCAPTPHPASSTRLPRGYAVSECSSSTSVPA